MAQNQNSSNSEGICKKFYKKLSLSTTSHQPAASVSSHKNKNVTFFLPKILSNRKEQRSTNIPCTDHLAEGEVAIVNEQGNDHKAVNVSAAKTKSLKDDGKFSDYIRKVKDKMRTVSNVGARKNATRRDSFNDRVSHFINRAKIKIRTTTNVGIDKDGSFK